MNFLELVQALWRESGSGGGRPSDVENQIGEKDRLVNWIKRAECWVIDQHADWGFLWAQDTFSTVADQAIYVPAVAVSEFDRRTFFLDGLCLEVFDYIELSGEPIAPGGRPYRAVIMPDRTIRLDGPPDGVYSVTYDYWGVPPKMCVSAEESVIPEPYRNTILGKALTYYGKYENAPEILQLGQDMVSEWMFGLESRHLPGERHAHEIAEGNEWVMTVE